MNRLFNDHDNAQSDAAKRLLLIRHNLRYGEGLKATTFKIEQNLNHYLEQLAELHQCSTSAIVNGMIHSMFTNDGEI